MPSQESRRSKERDSSGRVESTMFNVFVHSAQHAFFCTKNQTLGARYVVVLRFVVFLHSHRGKGLRRALSAVGIGVERFEFSFVDLTAAVTDVGVLW